MLISAVGGGARVASQQEVRKHVVEALPRYELTFGSTPIQPLRRLSAHLGGSVELYAKREDCNSGLAFGGNKTRKLEFLIPEALAQRCDTLVSIGGIQSNQTRQVAVVAAHLGMRCVLVQENWVNYCDAVYDRVGNIELSRILGRGSTPGSRRVRHYHPAELGCCTGTRHTGNTLPPGEHPPRRLLWVSGVLSGAAIVFYAYVGLDSVSAVSQDARNAQERFPWHS